MTIKGYLEQYREADRKARRLRREYEKEKHLIDTIKSPLGGDGLPHGTGISKTVEQRAIRLADKLLDYEEAQLDAIAIRQRIFDFVNDVDGIEGDVLYEYYVDYFDERRQKAKTWEDVAENLHISESTVYRIRFRILNNMTLNDSKRCVKMLMSKDVS